MPNTAIGRLLKIGSIAESIGVYVPAMILQKGLGLVRLLLFAYLMKNVPQYGLWVLGLSVFTIAAPVLTLGSNQGLIRYVSYYDARGQLASFYRRVRWGIPLCILAASAVAFVLSRPLTSLLMVSRGGSFTFDEKLHVCWAALANGVVMAFYYNIIGFLVGLRAYRLVSVLEFLFSAAFTAAGYAALLISPTAVAILLAHLLVVTLSTVGAWAIMHYTVRDEQASPSPASVSSDPLIVEPAGEIDEVTGTTSVHAGPSAESREPAGPLARTLKYGIVAMLANLLWLVAQNVSFLLVNKYGEKSTGDFGLFLQLSQMVMFVANAAWAVILAYVVRKWEGGRRSEAMFTLETAYKAIALLMMTVTVIVYLSCPLWVRALPAGYRQGAELLGGLLMFFQAVTQLALLTIITNLHERPLVSAAAALAGAALNALLAIWWMPDHMARGASWAAGIGMYVGGLCVAMAYFILSGTRFHPSTYFVLLAPGLLALPLLAPTWALAAAWGGLFAWAVLGNWCFDARQKAMLAGAVRGALRLKRGGA